MIMKTIVSFLLISASLSAAPKAVVFDFGGVMTGAHDRESVIAFLCNSLHLTRPEFEKFQTEKREAIKTGKTDEEFWLEYAEKHGIKLPVDWGEQLKTAMVDALNVNTPMYFIIKELGERKIRVGLLSNIDERLARFIRGFGLFIPFEPCLLSYEIGAEKPDPKAYETLIEKLKMPAKEIVFIDDKQENVDAAKRLGIDAILFQSPDQIRHELQKRTLLS
jgi:FMN phosphatase YigB (HAD superfamily)